MKSKEFITESKMALAFKYAEQLNLDPAETLFALNVKEECQPFLRDCKAGGSDPFILYRSVKGEDKIIERKVRLTDRRPLNMPPMLHNALNDYFTKHYGYPFRNGLFTTGEKMSAEGYGDNVYFVFPTGNYKFIWAGHDFYDDLYIAWQKFKNSKGADLDKDNLEELVEHFLNEADFSTKHIVQAAEFGNEIMIWTPKYYGIRTKYWEELTMVMYDEVD